MESESDLAPITNDNEKDLKSIGIKIERSITVGKKIENDRYEVTYYFSQGAIALIINLSHLIIGPIIVPVLSAIFGKYLLRAMVFDWSKLYLKGDFLKWFWVAASFFTVYYYADSENNLLIAYSSVGTVVLTRLLIVSVKYGYYSAKSWERLNKTKVDFEFIMSNMILAVWVKVPEKIARKEILASLRKLRIAPAFQNLKFLSNRPESLNNGPSDLKTVYIETLATDLIIRVTGAQETFELQLAKVFGIIYAVFIFILPLLAAETFFITTDPVEILYINLSMIIAYISSHQIVSFIAAGVYDFKRKKLLMAQCSALISKTDQKYLFYCSLPKPELDLNDPLTVISWYYLRRAFLNFGQRYTNRVFLYVSLLFPVCILTIVMLFVQFLGLVNIKYSFYLVPGLMLAIAAFAMIVQMSLAAFSLNSYFAIHRDLLLECSFQLRNKQDFNKDALKNLDFIIRKLKYDAFIRPIKILGVIINSSFILKIIFLGVTGFFSIIQLGLQR